MTTNKIQHGTCPLNEHLVTFSSVPIRIDYGSFVLIENELEYFKLMNNQLSSVSRLFTERETVMEMLLSHDASATFLPLRESIPSRVHLETLRTYLHSSTSTSPPTCTSLNNPLAEIVYEGLYVEFYRKHNGGGSGINVDIDILYINELKMNAPTGTTNLNSAESPVSPYATRSSKDIYNSSSKSNNSSGQSQRDQPQSLFASKVLLAPRLNEHENGISVRTQQFKYRQYDVGNLRKCDIYVANSSLILNLPVILSVVGYFLETITLNYMRNTAWMKSDGEGPFDFRRGLDVEIHSSDLCLTLPDNDDYLDASALCMVINLYYSHCWRGFTTIGPAKTTTFADIEVVQMFMAHMSNVKESFTNSIINSFKIQILRQYNIIPSEETFEHNAAVLAKKGSLGRHMSLSPQTLSIQRTDTPSIIQHLEVSIVPCSSTSMTPLSSSSSSVIPSPFTATTTDEVGSVESQALVFIKVSVNDISFISRAVGYMISQLKRRIYPPPLEEAYATLLCNFDDLNHLPKQTFYHRHAPLLNPLELRSTETNIKPFLLEIVIHNNTYNVDIIKSSLSLRQLHHTKYKDGNHAAFGFIMEAWLQNDEIGEWEPLIEKMDVTFVSSVNEVEMDTHKQKDNGSNDSNAIISTQNPKLKELLRFDLYALPVEISISHVGLVGNYHMQSMNIHLFHLFYIFNHIDDDDHHHIHHFFFCQFNISFVCFTYFHHCDLFLGRPHTKIEL